MLEFLIPQAMAADAGAAPGGIPMDIFILVAFALVFYFIVWRPQSKRTKEHRALVTSIAKGDEIITNGGLIGKVTSVDDQFLLVEVADKVIVRLQKGAVTSALPKGTIKSVE